MRQLRDLNWAINSGNFGKLAKGKNPNFFLIDTGVIIDLEDNYHDNGKHKENMPAVVLSEIEREHNLIITRGVVREIERHAQSMKGNRYEVSSSTSILVQKIYEDSKICFDELKLGLDSNLIEEHRYAVVLAAYHAFKFDYRKGVKDTISDTDKELLCTALNFSRYTFDDFGCRTVNIISTDNHVLKTINVLKSNNGFQDYDIRTLNSRGNLKSYLSK